MASLTAPSTKRVVWIGTATSIAYFTTSVGVSAAARLSRIDDAVFGEVVDQRSRTGGKVVRHGFAGQLAVMFGQRRHYAAVVFDRLAGPARDGGKNGFRRITGDP